MHFIRTSDRQMMRKLYHNFTLLFYDDNFSMKDDMVSFQNAKSRNQRESKRLLSKLMLTIGTHS